MKRSGANTKDAMDGGEIMKSIKELRTIRGARARVALDRVRESAARAGTANMPMSKVNAIVADVRRAKSKA